MGGRRDTDRMGASQRRRDAGPAPEWIAGPPTTFRWRERRPFAGGEAARPYSAQFKRAYTYARTRARNSPTFAK